MGITLARARRGYEEDAAIGFFYFRQRLRNKRYRGKSYARRPFQEMCRASDAEGMWVWVPAAKRWQLSIQVAFSDRTKCVL